MLRLKRNRGSYYFVGLYATSKSVLTLIKSLPDFYGSVPTSTYQTFTIVAAFGLDEHTVAAWQQRAGVHCEKVHHQLIAQGQLDLQHVQADEIRAKARGMVIWLEMAIAAGSRLWLGGVSSTKRDRAFIDGLVQLVASCALPLQPLLVCVDGLAAYPKSIKRVFRLKLAKQPGQRGRSRLALWPELVIGVVIKRTERKGKWQQPHLH